MRNPNEIMAEAKDIGSKFRSIPRNVPKDPRQVARLVALFEERGLPLRQFAGAVGLSDTTIYLWSKGCRTTGGAWTELQTEIAMRRGAALSNVINADMQKPAAPEKPLPATEASQAEGVKRRDASSRLRASVLGEVKDATAATGWQGDPANVVKVIAAYRRSKWAIDHFAKSTGLKVDMLRMWNAGLGKSGGEWNALRAMMTVAGMRPSTRAMTAKEQRESVAVTREAPSPAAATLTTRRAFHSPPLFPRPASSRVKIVTKYLDEYGIQHDTEVAAHEANLRGDVNVSAKALWDVVTVEDDLRENGDLVLLLAQAIRAERDWLAAHHATASA